MDTEILETFIEVAESSSFSRSAKALNVTQPAVSKRIASLESALSAKLFDRAGRSVHLTEAGRILLPSAKQIQSELTRIDEAIGNIGQTVGGKLTICTTAFVGTHRLPALLRTFLDTYPAVRLDLKFKTVEDVMAGIDTHRFELALCPLTGPIRNKIAPYIETGNVWSNRLRIVVSNRNQLASEPNLTIEKLLEHPAILTPRNSFIRTLLETRLGSMSPSMNVSLETADCATIRSMSAAGLGWTCLPEFQLDESLTPVDIEGLDLNYSVALLRRNDMTLTRAARAFIDVLAATAGPSPLSNNH